MRRRQIIAVLFFAQALVYAWYLVTGLALVAFSGTEQDNKYELLQQSVPEAIGLAVSVAFGVLAWRGSRTGLRGAVFVSAISLLMNLPFFIIELPWMGPYAILVLLFPLPILPFPPLTLAILILSLTITSQSRLDRQPPNPENNADRSSP